MHTRTAPYLRTSADDADVRRLMTMHAATVVLTHRSEAVCAQWNASRSTARNIESSARSFATNVLEDTIDAFMCDPKYSPAADPQQYSRALKCAVVRKNFRIQYLEKLVAKVHSDAKSVLEETEKMMASIAMIRENAELLGVSPESAAAAEGQADVR